VRDTTNVPSDRYYLMGRFERLRRHIRTHFKNAFLGGVSSSAIAAGFLDATGVSWSLLHYVILAASMTTIILSGQAVANPRYRYMLLAAMRRKTPKADVGLPALPLLAVTPSAPIRQIEAASCPDPIYRSGLRAICGTSMPLVVVASNRRDVSKPEELLFPLFTTGLRHGPVQVDLTPAGIPLGPYIFERELPDGSQDSEHTLAIKDLVYLPELGDALRRVGAVNPPPLIRPEHCVDPQLLASRDLIIVGGADTNFWHAALFEPVAREFEDPRSSVPLALDLRDTAGTFPTYGSRVLTARLAELASVFSHTRNDEVELDERVYPTYGMILACRNPYATAIGQSRWCLFIAGTRSLGTSGGVLALSLMLEAMHGDPTRNFYSEIPTVAVDVRACVSAILYRTTEVDQSMLRRGNEVIDRERKRLTQAGLDSGYSDTYVPTAVEYLSYDNDQPSWRPLGVDHN
jgi:hypothetical protein